MSATYTTYCGLGVPSLDDTDYLTTFLNTLTRIDAMSPLRDFRVREQEIPSTTLVCTITGGTLHLLNGTEVVVSSASQALTGSTTNYIYIDNAGVITKNTTGFPASTVLLRLATIVTGVSSITSITDNRTAYGTSGLSIGTVCLALAGGTMTGLPVFSGTGSGAGVQFTTTAAPGSPADGQIWYDSTAKAMLGLIAGGTARFPSTQFLATASATVANTVIETSLIGTGQGTATLPANMFAAGKTIRVKASGFLSTTGSPTANIQVKLGSLALATGAVAAGTGLANAGFCIEAEFTCRTPGAAGTFIGQSKVTLNGVDFHGVATATSVLDSTAALAVACTVTWGTASASNTITVTNFIVEINN